MAGGQAVTPVEEIATIVVCDGDQPTLDLLCEHFVEDRFKVLPAPSGTDALRLCRFNHPDLLILGLSLPDMPGIDVIQQIREGDRVDGWIDPNLPIIVFVRQGMGAGLTRSREFGPDDYLQKPFSYPELKGRVTAVLRRRHSRHDTPIRVGELVVDPGRRKVTVGEREVQLAKKEFTLLRVLASDPTRVFSKDELIRDVWGVAAPPGRTRTLDSHASRLRRKLDPDAAERFVINCWGIGYRLVEG
jgi:DNA-binding response OmpR family regulator